MFLILLSGFLVSLWSAAQVIACRFPAEIPVSKACAATVAGISAGIADEAWENSECWPRGSVGVAIKLGKVPKAVGADAVLIGGALGKMPFVVGDFHIVPVYRALEREVVFCELVHEEEWVARADSQVGGWGLGKSE